MVCGDVEGRFNQLFKRIVGIQKKTGPFEMLFCVGEFFGADNSEWAAYASGQSQVPVPTFILGPNKAQNIEYFTDINGCELCENVTYLAVCFNILYPTPEGTLRTPRQRPNTGRRGVYTASSGLQVGYLSGQDSITDTQPDLKCSFTADDISALWEPLLADSKFPGLDILLTSPWPRGVEKYAAPADIDSNSIGSPAIAQLARSLKPQYHFCALEGVAYERQPYRNHRLLQEGAKQATRFLALAKVGNSQKKKYLYAFNITPLKYTDSASWNKLPDDVTECPFQLDNTILRSSQSKEEKAPQFFYDERGPNTDRSGGKRGQKRAGDHHGDGSSKKSAQPQGPCWFCLGSPEVEKHLVVSVGTHTYLALAKGGLTWDHILICPISHHQSLVSCPKQVVDEIDKYKEALNKCYRKHGKVVVYFERNYKTAHLQIQAVPVPADYSEDIQESFQELALSQDIELHLIPKLSDLRQIVPEGAPYFYAELPSGDKLLKRINKGFPLQFGREALAQQTVLNMPGRADWRNCKQSKEEETETALKFKEMFKKFDFTMQ